MEQGGEVAGTGVAESKDPNKDSNKGEKSSTNGKVDLLAIEAWFFEMLENPLTKALRFFFCFL